ncbi:MAG TPA: amidohydrolase family protein, partial [Gemmatales bacterium]|nr:amidohydrolase family protein [Gemmatales bacterium]
MPAERFRTWDRERLQRRLRVAQGLEPGDLLLRGGAIVDVFTQTVRPADVVVADGVIAGVGQVAWSAKETIDLAGRTVLPGLIDGHIHIESTLLMPARLAEVMVPLGTTALIADPHEVGNVLGVRGIDLLAEASAGLPLDCFFMASSCVPASTWEEAGATLKAAEVGELLQRGPVLGLAEMMDFPAVLGGQAGPLDKILASWNAGRPVDGHAPGLAGAALQAYVAAGMRSDHESTHTEEARAKAQLGMMIQVREGSAEHNLDELLPLLVADELGDWCLASDDVFPSDLRRLGHLDGLLRRLVAAGVPPARAVRHASLVPARHYGLRDRGGLAPGYRADLVVVNNLTEFRVERVFKDGILAARDGRYTFPQPPPQVPLENTVHLGTLSEGQFVLRLGQSAAAGKVEVPVVGIIPDQIVTRKLTRSVSHQDGQYHFQPEEDVLVLANVERHRGSGHVGLGLVSGFGLKRHAALGSSVGHDAHNLVMAGSRPSDLLAAARAL